MKKLLVLAGVGAAGWLLSRPRRPRPPLDLTEPHVERPQEPIEEIERRVDVPGGVRP